MTTDLKTQIRGYFDEIDPPFEPVELMAHPAAGRISDGRLGGLGWQRFPRWAVAAATAVAVLLLVGGVALSVIAFGADDEIIEQPTPTSVPEKTDGPIGAQSSNFINQVEDLALAPNGTLWVATRGGVVEWPVGASSPIVYGEEDGLPGAAVEEVAVATDGTVWAAGYGWIAYFDQTWQPVEPEDTIIRTMVADPQGGVWTTATSGEGGEVLLHVDRNGTETVSLPVEGMGWTAGLDIAVDATGRVYAVDIADTQVVLVYDEGTWSELATTEQLYEDLPLQPAGEPGAPLFLVRSIEVAPDGTVWVSIQGLEGTPAPGIASLRGQTWTMHTTSDGLASTDGAVTIGADGTVWVIHGDAVSRREGETWVVHEVADSGGSGAVGGSDGTLWLGTDSGIVRFDGATATRLVVPAELAPAPLSFSLEPAASADAPFDAGSFGEVAWQRFDLPTAHHLTGGIDTANGFAAMDGGEVRTTVEGLEWAASEPPLNAWRLVASGDDLYALGGSVVRLAWTGATWKAVDELSIPDAGDSFERMAFGDGVTVLTARSRVFFSTDGHTFVPALQGPDSGLLAGAGEPDSDDGYAGGCDSSWFGGPDWDSIGPVFSTGNGFVAFTSGHPNDWNTNVGLCRPIVWLSNDGSTWDLVSSDSPFGPNALVHAVEEHNGRFVAVGGRGREGLLWVSNDGLTWSEIPQERIDGSISKPWAIAAGEAGWVALFGGAGTAGEVRAMYSLDGLEWAVDTDPIPELTWAFGAPDVAVGTDRILVTYFMESTYIGEIAR